jgi:hypothetical protein
LTLGILDCQYLLGIKVVTINTYVNLKFKLGDQKFNKRFYATGLGKQRIIFGFPWLHKYNPIIDWKKGEITFKLF